MKQRIICAAIKRNFDNAIICGPRHFDSIMIEQIRRTKESWVTAEQGFVDQFGKFISREDAWIIAEAQNQIVRRVGGDEGKLFSENLY